MPILDVEVVVEAREQLADDLAGRLADVASTVFESAPGETWVRLRPFPATGYAENGGGPPDGIRPVFITVLKRRLPDLEERADECLTLTRLMARVLERPTQNVHLLYLPEGAGRVSFGGRLLR